ncbi:DUF1294 domain-containing protein [Metabacillus fastidiosus]|uniref:DUF1294 domain-containing protein n=1 Tax=Metabacillus fastidiosus TaxID=1458 RepID=UPI002DBCFB0D|nr:DUF1294 domain-containing protein [Metabacillus fastidiosus]MEC2077640.1 DUF1294 domain-containing protein [Metabacillus fastidiosus]
MIYLFFYYLLINIYSFIKMAGDKKKAKRHEWRVPESVLMSLGIFGGAFGLMLAMNVFRHKTQHAKFKYGVPLLAVLHVCVLFYLVKLV